MTSLLMFLSIKKLEIIQCNECLAITRIVCLLRFFRAHISSFNKLCEQKALNESFIINFDQVLYS